MSVDENSERLIFSRFFLVVRSLSPLELFCHLALPNTPPDEFHVRVAKTLEEITELLEADFEYVLQKDELAYFRKRK